MNTPSRWFRFGRRAPGAAAAPLRSDVLNSGTWATAQDLIDLQRYAGKIGLTHAGPARARRAGDHLSRFRGRGMDYQESRGYQAGDDIRSMDWRVTARTGNPHVKVYQEERERPVVVFVDLNPGMFFGTQGMLKSVLAARAAALIAWAALAHGDRVGAMLFNGEHSDLQPRGGKRGVLRLIRQLVAHTDPRAGIDATGHDDGLNAALGRLRRVARPGSLVVLISDFYGIDDESARHLSWLRRHNDVVALQIVDTIEEEPPPSGRYGVATPGGRSILDTGSSTAHRAYVDYFGRHHEQVRVAMRRHAIPLLRLSTGGDLVGALRWHFAAGDSPAVGPAARIDDRLAA
ncbi:MAG: DUF58 domain-containing protein [Caldimonas sp.]|nr:DUF58 domain-containing protein [Pseudomonadota bacterium]